MSAQLLCAILLQLGSAGDKGGVDITITTNETKSGEFYNIKTLTVASGVTLTASEFIIIRAEKIIINGSISADGVNTTETSGAGGDGTNSDDGGGGAAHGAGAGAGGTGSGSGGSSGSSYSTSTALSVTAMSSPDSADDLQVPDQVIDINQGSNGGAGGVAGGSGGGRIILISESSIEVSGTVTAAGNNGTDGGAGQGGGGGGSGGGIVLAAPDVTVSGTVSASGGNGGNGGAGNTGGGGGASGGIIKVFYDSLSETGTISVTAGSGGSGNGTGSGGASGSAGTISRAEINFRPDDGGLSPSVSGVTTVNGADYLGSSTATLNLSGFSDPNDTISNAQNRTHAATQWQVTENEGNYNSTVADSGYSSTDLTSRSVTGLKEKKHFFRARLSDSGDSVGYGGDSSNPSSADNELESIYSAEKSFTVDLTAPDTPEVESPKGVTVNASEITFKWKAVGSSVSGISHYKIVVKRKSDGKVFIDTTTTKTSYSTTSLENGSYTWEISAEDNVGNAGGSASAEFLFVSTSASSSSGTLGLDGESSPKCGLSVMAGDDDPVVAIATTLIMLFVISLQKRC